MLMMVIEKPVQFTMVSDVPLNSSATFCATRVENNGESATTAIPQIKRKMINSGAELLNKNSGESRQQQPETNSAIAANLFMPKRCDNTPLNAQAIPPDAMIKNEKKETSIL